jgi:hypothetical protein
MDKVFTGSAEKLSPLAEPVHKFRHYRCTESRNKVFGLLNLAEICCGEAITADYSSRWSLHAQNYSIISSTRIVKNFFSSDALSKRC